MDGALSCHTGRTPTPDRWHTRWWIVALGLMFLWHAHMSYSLFGTTDAWARLTSDDPICSGRHPLHLYHGYLGAQSFLERGSLCCYDPAFQAGYPKTPVFDSGSKPAELFLALVGGAYRPAVYKIGLLACCLLVPCFLLLAGYGLALGKGTTFLGTCLGLLLWWGEPCRWLLVEGDLDLVFGSLCAGACAGLLAGYHREAGFLHWLGLLVIGTLGWFTQPVIFMLFAVLVLLYYVSFGTKHGMPWHLGFWGAALGAILLNSFWLFDWLEYWWILSPVQIEAPLLQHRTIAYIWAAPLWGDALDRCLIAALVLAAVAGAWILNARGQRPAARLFGLGSLGFLLLAMAGFLLESLGRLGSHRLLVAALFLAVFPAAYALCRGLEELARLLARPRHLVWILGSVGVCLVLVAQLSTGKLVRRLASAPALQIGLNPADKELVQLITDNTTADSRILLEGFTQNEETEHWSALLPLLTGRSFLGGLDPDACIEHTYASFINQSLAGRPIGQWRDAELELFCRRYNVGWVVCHTASAVSRFQKWKDAQEVGTELSPSQTNRLFRLRPRSFVLKGEGRVVKADWRGICLADVMPEDGKVILSMHYQEGMRVSPSRIKIEKDVDPLDPIPFIRLSIPAPITRLMLTWE